MTAFVWPPEAVERLRALRQAGVTFSGCTRALNAEFGSALSRNAVIGKAQRIGLCQSSSFSPRAKPSSPRATESMQAIIDLRVMTAVSKPVAVCNARPHDCRWPLGDPKSPDFRFCGARRIEPLPYCPDHALLAYRPAAKRKGHAA